MTIRAKMIAGYLAIIVILVAASAVLLFQFQELVRHTIGHGYTRQARAIVDELDRAVHANTDLVKLVATTTPEIERLLETSAREFARIGSDEDIEAYVNRRDAEWVAATPSAPASFAPSILQHPVSNLLRRKQAFFTQEHGYPVFSEILVTNKHGANVAQTDLTTDYRQDDEAWWQAAREAGVWVGDVGYDESAAVFSQDIVVAIKNAQGEFLGVLKAVLNAADLEMVLERCAREAEYDTAYAELIDREGQLIYRNGILAGAGKDVSGEKAVAAVLAGHDGYTTEQGALTGTTLLRAYARSRDDDWEGAGWSVVLNLDLEEVLHPVDILWRGVLVVGLGAVAIAALLALLIPTSLLRPLHGAVAVADRLATGDLGAQVRITSRDEIGRLLRAMQRTMDYIRDVASVAGRIAVGDVRVQVTPVSPRDELNRSFARTTEYLASVSDVAERISQNDLLVGVSPRSEADVLSNSLRRMIANLQMIVRQIAEAAGLVLTTAEQLSGASQQITAGAEDQSRAGGATEAAVKGMADAMRKVASRSEELLAGATGTLGSIQEMSTSIRSVASSTTELADSAAQTVATIAEMDASMDNVMEHAGTVGEVSAAAVVAARDGSQAVERTIEKMGSISELMDQIVDVIQGLERSSREIGRIVDTMDDIADQSNMLALNAAITAAQAGEAGGGFTVVATEIRRLAAHSRESSGQIARLIAGLQRIGARAIEVTRSGHAEVREGVALATQAGAMLARIGDTVEMAHGRMSEVMSATEAQATASARAVLTIRTMAHMVGQIEAATRQQADGSARISEAVEAMEARIREVAASSGEQLEDASRVLAAMADIVRISAENRSTAADIAGITRVLHLRAEELQTITSKFRT